MYSFLIVLVASAIIILVLDRIDRIDVRFKQTVNYMLLIAFLVFILLYFILWIRTDVILHE